jgi:hypothetical protein
MPAFFNATWSWSRQTGAAARAADWVSWTSQKIAPAAKR